MSHLAGFFIRIKKDIFTSEIFWTVPEAFSASLGVFRGSCVNVAESFEESISIENRLVKLSNKTSTKGRFYPGKLKALCLARVCVNVAESFVSGKGFKLGMKTTMNIVLHFRIATIVFPLY